MNSYDSAAGGEQTQTVGEYGQKLIYTYYYDFETLNFDQSIAYITQRVEELGGYLESTAVNGSSYRNASLTVRIPQTHAKEFLSDTASIGEIQSQSTTAEDVTLEFYDVQSRLESLHAQHDRLIELIDRAENLSDIAELENQLSNVEYEISRYQTRMNVLSNRIDYVTIHMSLQEVYQITPQEEDTVLTRIEKGLSRNLRGLKNDFIDFFVWFVTSIPNLIVDAVILVLAIIVLRWLLRIYRKFFKTGSMDNGSGSGAGANSGNSKSKSKGKLFRKKKGSGEDEAVKGDILADKND